MNIARDFPALVFMVEKGEPMTRFWVVAVFCFFWAPIQVWAWENHELLLKQMETVLLVQLKPSFSSVDLAELSKWIDEPDNGMDQNLPESDDPLNERQWMGGKQGLGSQGFRHMFFGGWNWKHPITTLQFPLRSLGQAPNRVQEAAEEAQKFFREGNRLDGIRRLGWALHYLEDLSQPYHAVQIPSGHFLVLKPHFSVLVSETTRRVANYHLSMEHYLAFRLQQGGIFEKCFQDYRTIANLPKHLPNEPKQLALALAQSSVSVASSLAKAQIHFISDLLDGAEVDLRIPRGEPNYQALSTAPEREIARKNFEYQACTEFANATEATLHLIESVLNVKPKN